MHVTPRPLGLYLHIPFCRQKCAYCDFYSLSGQDARMDDYVDALCAHLTEAAPSASAHQIDTIYFGGGTPSLLGVKRLTTLLKTVCKRYHVAKDAEGAGGGRSRILAAEPRVNPSVLNQLSQYADPSADDKGQRGIPHNG